MRPTVKKYILLIGPLLLMLPFNNCTNSGFQISSDSSELSSQAEPQFDGKTLYSTNCSACHGPLESSEKLGRSTADIQQALAQQPAMKFLTTLTTSQIELISGALNPTNNSVPVASGKPTDFKVLTTNRYMLKSNLSTIFVADSGLDASDTAINTVLDNLITSHPEAFGGNCTRNDPGCSPSCGTSGDPDCMGKLDISTSASPVPIMSAVSQGYLIRACEETLNIDKAVNTALSKVGLVSTNAPALKDLPTVINYFYRDKPFDGNTSIALMNLVTQMQAKGYSTLDQWRFTLLPLCVSSSLQML